MSTSPEASPGAAGLRCFDAHLHIIDPRFPLVANQGYLPEPFTCADYRSRARAVGLFPVGGAVVSGSFQAFDQGYLVDALQQLGNGFVGVTNLPAKATDAEILELDAAGVRAVRFNLFRGGSEGVAQLDRLARRIHELAGWHVELYMDARQLEDLGAMLSTLPAVCIDHLGLSRDGLPLLLRQVERGAYVKATGFSRTDLDVPAALSDLCAANPRALLFGSDLPCTRAPRPFGAEDLRVLQDALPAETLQDVLLHNAHRFYRVPAT